MRNTKSRQRAVIVPASAGSGKTFRIAHEYIYDALRNHKRGEEGEGFDPTIYKRILAVTFTNKATEEMKSRILEEIHLLAANKQSQHLTTLIEETGLDEAELRRRAKIVRSSILHDYSHFTVLTNDTFFQRVLRAFIRELGIDINFSTELDTAPIFQKSVEALIEDIVSNKELRQWLSGLTKENIEEGKSWNIRNAIIQLNKELFKESNRDIIDKLNDKEQIEKIVSAFVEHTENLKAEYSSLGKVALKTMEKWGVAHTSFTGNFTKFIDPIAQGEVKSLTPSVIAKINGAPEDWLRKKDQQDATLLACVQEMQDVLKELYDKSIEVNTTINSRNIITNSYRSFALLYDLQQKVAEICRDDNMMLLSNTKHAISKFISEQDTPFIYEKVGNYFDKFMIDEFQDTSYKEWRNFLPLLKNAMAQSEENSVLIVGDVKQSIYRFRGSDWNILGSIAPNDLGDYESIPLEHNWRSLPNIVNFNNLLFRKLTENGNESLNSMLNEAKEKGVVSEASHKELYDTLKKAYTKCEQIPARKHTNEGFVDITYTPAEVLLRQKESGEPLVPPYIRRIRTILEQGFLPRDITILVRFRSDGVRVANELLAAREEFPEELRFEITTEEALSIESSSAVMLILSILRLAINRNDVASLAYYNQICHDSEFGRALSEEEQTLFDEIRMLSPEEAFERIIIEYKDHLVGQTAYVQALHNQITKFSAGRVSDIALFDKWWREVGYSGSVRIEKSDRAIEILTIHKAKGLENKVVIIPYCLWEYTPKIDNARTYNIVWAEPTANTTISDLGPYPVPYTSAMEQSFFAEGFYRERVLTFVDAVNLLYVATTRAKEQLHIFATQPLKGSNIGMLLVEAISEHTVVDDEGIVHYNLGRFDKPEPQGADKKTATNILLDEYHASPVGVKFRTSTSRYFGEEDESKQSPRSMGIKLHRAFENASTREEVLSALKGMTLEGQLSQNEYDALHSQIIDTLENTIAGEWFSDKWEKIDRERSIIRPSDSTKRPDRIMRCGDEAVVVDYKFGKPASTHNKQIKTYLEALRNMGYNKTRGYLWYVPTGKIVEVKAAD